LSTPLIVSPDRSSSSNLGGGSPRPNPDRDRLKLERGVAILVVDDVSDTRSMYASYFHYVGATVLIASDGVEALRIIEEQEPDALLLDLSMPRMDGGQVLETLRSDARTRDLPVVVVTGKSPAGGMETVLTAGADLYLTKPCLPHIALRFILQVLQDRSSDRRA
jgi:CheY-like chemotaxis protein